MSRWHNCMMYWRRGQDAVTVLLAAWMLVSLWVMRVDVGSMVGWSILGTAGLLLILGVIAMEFGKFWEDGLELVLGLWLAVTPWALGYTFGSALRYNALIVGLVIFVLSSLTLIGHRIDASQAAATTTPITPAMP